MNVEQCQAAADPQVVQKRKLGEVVSYQNQNVNAIKNQREVSLVYCTNQTKRLMEKPKTKLVSSPVSVKAVRWKGWGLWQEGFKEKVFF